MQNAARQVQEHFARGDWPTGVREGLAEITGRLGGFAATGSWPPYVKPDPADADPEWGKDTAGTGDPARDLDRLLDRFRDDIRDAARDRGVTEAQLTEARRHLSTAAAHIGALLRKDAGDQGQRHRGPGSLPVSGTRWHASRVMPPRDRPHRPEEAPAPPDPQLALACPTAPPSP